MEYEEMAEAYSTSEELHANQILKLLHWLKVPDRIEYKVISVTYKLLQSSAPHLLLYTPMSVS